MREAEVNKPAFLWSGIFILLPLFLLAALGLYFLRQDRDLARLSASQHCASIAELIAGDASQAIFREAGGDSTTSSIEFDEHNHLKAIGGFPSRAVDVGPPSPRLFPTDALTSEQAALWNRAQNSKFQPSASSNACVALRQFIDLQPPEPFLAQSLYDLALLQQSAALFQAAQTNRDALTEAGVPIWLLAQSQELRLGPHDLALTISLCSNAVNYPSFATPSFLAQISPPLEIVWSGRWNEDQAARDLFQTVQSKIPADEAFWARWRNQDWLLRRSPAPLRHRWLLLDYPLGLISNSVLSILRSDLSKIPSYAAVNIEIAGRAFIAPLPHLDPLAEASAGPTVSAGDPSSGARFIRVRLLLAQPDLLFAEQRRRALWFAAIIVASALAATIALINSHRAFRQQILLSDMKTNFVSSVSHELRAPVASMRLLAEGLDRGKISAPPKQREYFKLLAQESRRLSTLIENILDYSRIDQGRKTYEKEPTDLAALVAQTVALMSVTAVERRVTLAAPTVPPDFDPVVHCDGLAIRQALINLLDNAIKHSPPDSTVNVGLARNSHTISLWVEDHGLGIPLDEREKIFERFYRRGPELRRETQGIGIGLTIVRHILNAHGGRVLVSGEVGHGSRFTLEWPVDGGPDV